MKQQARKQTIIHIVLIVFALVWVLPLVWIILTSFDRNGNVFVKLPVFTFENFTSVLLNKSNQRAFINSLVLSFGVAIVVIVCAGLAGYALSRYEMKHKRSFMMTILFMSALPATVLIIPVYRMFVAIKLNDSLLGIILFMAASTMPYSLWMMKNYIDSIPIYLEEAASVDGANFMQKLSRIVLPLMVPGIFCVAIQAFIGAWGNFMTPFILLRSSEKYPAAISLYQYIGQWDISYGQLAAFSIIYSIPVLILYLISQRYMAKGFSMSGAGKG